MDLKLSLGVLQKPKTSFLTSEVKNLVPNFGSRAKLYLSPSLYIEYLFS
jgi:hypothetical protein